MRLSERAEVLALPAGRKEIEVKNSKWLLAAGLVIMMMSVGCKKMGEPVDVAGTAANPLVLPLVTGNPSFLVGHVLVWDDESNLYVQYKLDALPADGKAWEMIRCEFDVQIDSTAFPWTGTNPALVINPGLFLYTQDPIYPYQEYTFTIPNVGGWMTGLTVAAAAHCILRRSPTDDPNNPYTFDQMSGWAQDPNHPFKYGTQECKGWWFPYTLEVPHQGEWHMNTAWGGKAYPNWADWKFPGKNWALYIRYNPVLQTQYVGSLYAGNPKNDAANKVVGTVTVSDDVVVGVGNIYVTYTITKADRAIFSGHTIVRGKLSDIPQANGNPIPGKFDNFFGPFDPPEDQVTVTIPYKPAWGTDLYIGAHAAVGWYY